jgi:hypothetical protein
MRGSAKKIELEMLIQPYVRDQSPIAATEKLVHTLLSIYKFFFFFFLNIKETTVLGFRKRETKISEGQIITDWCKSRGKNFETNFSRYGRINFYNWKNKNTFALLKHYRKNNIEAMF